MASPIQQYSLPHPTRRDTHTLQVSTVETVDHRMSALHHWGMAQAPCPTLVIVGGASGLDADSKTQVDTLFHQVLAPLAENLQLCVVDGGTDAGVMRLMGSARTEIGGTFPLIGVAPIGLVSLPDRPTTHPDACGLEPNHTHCLLVPGNQWGDESIPLAEIATLCAQGAPTLTVLINGGSVTWRDALASINENRPIVVIADALEGTPQPDVRTEPLLASGLLSALDLGTAPSQLTTALTTLLTP
jgi:hypothetical protein